MSKPWMTDAEIRLSYKNSGYKKRQIKILAELNDCSRDVIEKIIYGEVQKVKSTDGAGHPAKLIDLDGAIRRYESGESIASIARHFGVSSNGLGKMLANEGVIKRN